MYIKVFLGANYYTIIIHVEWGLMILRYLINFDESKKYT